MDKNSVLRYTLLIVATLNAVLNLMGYQTISDEFANNLAAIISGAVFLYTGWKNNYLSNKGKKQKEVLEQHNLK